MISRLKLECKDVDSVEDGDFLTITLCLEDNSSSASQSDKNSVVFVTKKTELHTILSCLNSIFADKAQGSEVYFDDLHTVLSLRGIALIGSGEGVGEDRALKALEDALTKQGYTIDDINSALGILIHFRVNPSNYLNGDTYQVMDFLCQRVADETDMIFVCTLDESIELESLGVDVVISLSVADNRYGLESFTI